MFDKKRKKPDETAGSAEAAPVRSSPPEAGVPTDDRPADAGTEALASQQGEAGDAEGAAAADAAKIPEPGEAQPSVDELRKKLDEAQDKYLRLMAEFDNYKRRMAREHQRMVESAGGALVQELIAVRENFQRALKTADGDADVRHVTEGMKLIFAGFDEILRRSGLEDFCDVGDAFDPQLHDALMRMPHEQIAEGHVADVYEKGYRLKGRVVRHARVIVSAGKARPEPAQEDPADKGADATGE